MTTKKNMFNFKITAKDRQSKARAGRITTAHGAIETPAFVPVGTKASVKSLTPQDLKEIGVQIFFGNTYHLHLRPGEDVIKDFGGLAKFMAWDGPTITDSGGFQVFSLGRAALRSLRQFGHSSDPKVSRDSFLARGNSSKTDSKYALFKSSPHAKAPRAARVSNINEDDGVPKFVKIKDDSVVFRSHLDGSLHEFTPEKSIEIQQKLGADIILAFDECSPYPSSYDYTKQAMNRTHKWALRSLEAFRCHPEFISGSRSSGDEMPKRVRHDKLRRQALYGIIQGGVYKDLREESAKFISSLPFDGIAIGGVAVGESKKEMRDVLDWTAPFLPEDKPRHFLGVGEIDDIFDSIEKGIDTFDCVIPTRMGRYGCIFAKPPEGNRKNKFMIDIKKSIFANDQSPLTKDCNCSVCKTFTRGYIHHLFRLQELLAYRLASYHNLYFINNLVAKIRKAILEGRFLKVKKQWLGI